MTDRYRQVLKRLFSVIRSASEKDMVLDHARVLDEAYGFPSRDFPIIHVAGTNGKGSTVTKLARILELAGYRVGMYTSPHISCFRERIRINGSMISQDEITTLLEQGFSYCDARQLVSSFFELTTCAAFKHFSNQKVDIAIVEVGVGGRLDATNIVTPILSIITSVDLDHTQFLGNTRTLVAKEKAGIIKSGVPVLVGPWADLPSIRQIAEASSSRYHTVQGSFNSYDDENNAIATAALKLISNHFPCSHQALSQGLTVRPPCRTEYFPIGQGVILDVAHNANGVTRLLQSLSTFYPNTRFQVVCGFSKDKEVHECLIKLAKNASSIHFVAANHDRAMPIGVLEKAAKKANINRYHSYPKVADGVHAAMKGEDMLLVCGSFFIMREVRESLGIDQEIDPFDLNEALAIKKP